MHIRAYRQSDAASLAQIFHRSIEDIGPQAYSPQQVMAWSKRGADAAAVHDRCSDGRFVWIATAENDVPVAFIDLQMNGHIDMLFCDPLFTGRGLASQLFAKLQEKALDLKLSVLTTKASAIAQPVFSHWGFRTLSRNDFEFASVAMFNFTMSKALP